MIVQRPALVSETWVRVLAGITLFMAIACLATLKVARSRSPVRFERTIGEHSIPDLSGVEAVEGSVHLAGLAFLVAAAASGRVAQAVSRRAPSSFLMGISPVIVILIVASALLVPQLIGASLCPGIGGLLGGTIGLFLAVGTLFYIATAQGYFPQRAMGVSPPGRLLGGMRSGLGGWLLVKPMMFVCLAGVVLIKFATGLQIRTQAAVEDVMSYSDASFGVAAVAIAVVVPILEEIAFRGFFYGSLRRHVGIAGAAIISGVVFALLHMSPDQLPALAVLGIVLALVYEKTQTIAAPILLHMLINIGGIVQIALLRAR